MFPSSLFGSLWKGDRNEQDNLNDVGFWYSRKNGRDRKMGFEERTPAMIAVVYGSTNVLRYIIATQKVDINKASGSDGATALHCTSSSGSSFSVETVKLLLDACADPDKIDDNGNKPVDLIALSVKSANRKALVMLLKVFTENESEIEETETVEEKKDYPVDVLLSDINDGVYSSDESRMFVFKVKPCSRAYSHDWTKKRRRKL